MSLQFEEKSACDVCGKFGAFAFDGRKLCTDCYEGCGSCCPEFGREEEAAQKVDESAGSQNGSRMDSR